MDGRDVWSPREAPAPCHLPRLNPLRRERPVVGGGTPGDLWGNWEWKRLVSTSYGGWAANPTDVLIPQWYGVNREDMVLQVTEEENSVTVLLPVAPKRCGRGAEPYSYLENGLEVSWGWQSTVTVNSLGESYHGRATMCGRMNWANQMACSHLQGQLWMPEGRIPRSKTRWGSYLSWEVPTQSAWYYMGSPSLTPLPLRSHPN